MAKGAAVYRRKQTVDMINEKILFAIIFSGQFC